MEEVAHRLASIFPAASWPADSVTHYSPWIKQHGADAENLPWWPALTSKPVKQDLVHIKFQLLLSKNNSTYFQNREHFSKRSKSEATYRNAIQLDQIACFYNILHIFKYERTCFGTQSMDTRLLMDPNVYLIRRLDYLHFNYILEASKVVPEIILKAA